MLLRSLWIVLLFLERLWGRGLIILNRNFRSCSKHLILFIASCKDFLSKLDIRSKYSAWENILFFATFWNYRSFICDKNKHMKQKKHDENNFYVKIFIVKNIKCFVLNKICYSEQKKSMLKMTVALLTLFCHLFRKLLRFEKI